MKHNSLTIQYVDNCTVNIKTPAASKEFKAAIKQIDPKAHWNRQPDKQYWTFHVPEKARELAECCFPDSQIIEEGVKPILTCTPSPTPQNYLSIDKDIVEQDENLSELIFRIQLKLNRLGYKSITICNDFTHTVVADYQVANF